MVGSMAWGINGYRIKNRRFIDKDAGLDKDYAIYKVINSCLQAQTVNDHLWHRS